ncbi:MAG TPA: hypothetical protein VJT71_10020 [Pyrinomonadaceae bacterium]|nr:hypothetical protein [Pyrinomonadaceae bacterium]
MAKIEAEFSLTPKQEKAVITLLNEPTLKEAATSAGVTETTLWRWMQEEAFRSAYMEARRAAVQRGIARMQSATCEAVETLRSVMNDQTSKGSERVSAAKAIIEFAYKGIDIEDVAARLAVVEALLKDKPK